MTVLSQFISRQESGLANRARAISTCNASSRRLLANRSTNITEAVFKPLGSTSSRYVWRPDFDARTATGYGSDGKPDELVKPTEALAASTLNTTAKDYVLFVEAVLNGKGLKPATLREMETPEIALDPECRICIKQEPK